MYQWRYHMRAYYGPNGRRSSRLRPNRGRLGERAGDLAIETVHTTKSSLECEVDAARARSDIGKIEIWIETGT